MKTHESWKEKKEEIYLSIALIEPANEIFAFDGK